MHWSYCGSQTDMSRDEATSSNAKIKPIALAVIKLHGLRLSEDISERVSE